MVNNRDIIDISLHLFATKGFHETTMENIAGALGLKKQSIYSHFKSKNEIICAVIKDQADQMVAEANLILAEYSDKPAEMLLKFLFARLAVFLAPRDRLLLWKRIFLLETSSDIKELLESSGWSFHRTLIGEVGRILRSRYLKFDSADKTEAFFLSYMIFIQGYLDWMLIMGYDVNLMESAWDSYWSGARSFFA